MKTAICIDSLISRDESVFLIELILNLFPNSEIYTIAHKRGGILGPIETRPIVSSFLSHKAKDIQVFKKNFWILPSAVKGIPFHKSIEKAIVISRGYIHGLNIPENVEKYLYIYDWDLISQDSLGWQKLFSNYVNDWREKSLVRYPKIAISSEALREKLYLPNAEVIQPTFRTEEYPFVKDEDHNFLFTHHLIHSHGIKLDEFKQIAKILKSKNEKVFIMGPTEYLEAARSEFPEMEFVGDHCEATTALYSHQAKVIWDLSLSSFPSRALGSLCNGRPVVVRDNKVNKEFLISGSYFIGDINPDSIENIYNEIENSYLSFDRKALRRLGLKWNERLFKSRMVKFLSRN